MTDKLLDVKNLACPMPVLKARKALSEMKPGQTLEVVATDPSSVADFKALCEAGKHTLMEQTQTGGIYRHVIQVGG